VSSMAAPALIATRGSALALAQANQVLAQCRAAFPDLAFELKIIKTTGDKLQTASLAQEDQSLPKGLFTKELEVALLNRQADLAVHSLKDLPTDLPAGLILGAVGARADVRDVLVYRAAGAADAGAGPADTPGRGYPPGLTVTGLAAGAVVATSSTRRKAQLLARRPDLQIPEIRGNVATRLRKLREQPALDATVLALAGITRLEFRISPEGRLEGEGVPPGLLATVLDTDLMLPCVGQGAVGIEIRADDEPMAAICRRLDDFNTRQCVTAERSFLAAMGGGCQSPVAAHAEARDALVRLRAISFVHGPPRRAEAVAPMAEAEALGRRLAAALRG
jgi:hydroxymethylbilane synthase